MKVFAHGRVHAPLAVAVLTLLAAPHARAGSAESIAEGDAHYAAARLAEARKSYAAAVQADPGGFEGLCRLSRAESELGELQSGDEQKRTWSGAVEHARAAVRAAPDSAAGHLWLAVALGRQARREGARARLALSKELKASVDRALERDPRLARAWLVRAVWNSEVASLNAMERLVANAVLGGVPKGASIEDAEHDFQRAIQLEPDGVHPRLEHARFLLDRGRKAEARRELEKAASLAPGADALDARHQAEARRLLARLE